MVLTEGDQGNVSVISYFNQMIVCNCRLNCLASMIRVLVWTKKSTSYTSFVISYTVLQFQKKNASWFQKKVVILTIISFATRNNDHFMEN